MKHLDNQFDDVRLEELLKKHGAIEPRAGLEARVFARLATERTQPSKLDWRWGFVVATLALGVVAGVVFIVGKPAPRHETATHSTPTVSPSQPKTLSAALSTKHGHVSQSSIRQKPPITAQPAAEPRLEQFPSPTPLTEQEQLLAHYIKEQRHEAVMIARGQAESANKEFSPNTAQLPTIQELPASE